jgi:hypothetical protein
MAPAEHLLGLVHSVAPALETPSERVGQDILAPLIALWCKTFESISSPRKRRVTAMGLAAILRSCGQAPDATDEIAQAVCGQLGEIAAVWSDCLGEIREHRGEA